MSCEAVMVGNVGFTIFSLVILYVEHRRKYTSVFSLVIVSSHSHFINIFL